MIKCLITIASCVMLSGTCLAESFQLKHDKTGKLHGPYEFKDGTPVVIGKASFTLVKSEQATSILEKKMKEIIIPKLEFRQAKITDVLNYLRQVSIDLDKTSGPEQKGVNLILKGNPEDIPSITLTLSRVSFSNALQYITDITGLTYRIDKQAVLIEPKK